jgi:3',5'-cyclic AMP phosphodiesterase CpdA
MRFVHISDLHIGEHGTRNALAEKLIDKIHRRYSGWSQKPLILITGDFVHDGQQDQFALAEKMLFKLHDAGFQILMCPGNHDYGKQGLDDDYNSRHHYNQVALKLTTRKSDGDSGFQNVHNGQWNYPIVNKFDDTYFIGLDTMEGVFRLTWYARLWARFSAAGWLGNSQLTKLEQTLKKIRQQTPDANIVLYMHHHPFQFNFRFKVMQLHDRQRLHNMIKDQVNILLFGHNHVEKRLHDQQKKYGIGVIQVFGTSTHDRSTPFYEIDSESRQVRRY